MKLKPFEIQMTLSQQEGANGPPSPEPSGHASASEGSSFPAPASAIKEDASLSPSTIRQWIEGLDEPIVVLDSGIIVGANTRAPALFGRQEGAIQGCHLRELVTEESVMPLARFLEYDDPEPALVLGVRQDQRTFPLKVKAIASIIGSGRRLRVTMLTRCGAVERPGDATPPPPG